MNKQLLRYFSITILVFISIVFLFSSFPPTSSPQEVSLGSIVERIEQGDVTELVVEGDTIRATLSDDSILETRKDSQSGIFESLAQLGVTQETLRSIPITIQDESGFSYWAGILLPSLIPLLIIGGLLWFMMRRAQSGASQALTFGKSTMKLFNSFKNKITFSDVAGLAEEKQELMEIVDFLKNPQKYEGLGAQSPRGVLLLGPPGTGKTLLARAVAGEAGVPFFHMSASEFVEMFVGVGASRTRDAFATAKKAAPSILFIDEIDAIGRERGAGLGGGHDEREQTLNQILVEMDGFDKDSRVVVIAATNRPDVLDKALLRPGRFDRHVLLDLPDINDREAILRIHARNKALAKDIDFRPIAVRTPGFSGADLENLMNEAAIFAARKNKKQVEQSDLLESIEKVLLGPEKRNRAFSKMEREVTAYHEAGHALVAASLKHADPVHKVSIISRGHAGGYTLKLPTEDRYLKTRKQFIADLAVMFGGYATEELIFNDLSTGASNDLSVASDIARKMVTKYGMGKFGPMTFGKTQEMVFLGKEMTTEKNYSDVIAHEIDTEVSRFIHLGYSLAKDILKKRKKLLEIIAQELMKKETLEKEEFDALIEKSKLKQLEVTL